MTTSIGQIDIDSDQKENAFTEDDEIALISAVADKLAEQIAAERR